MPDTWMIDRSGKPITDPNKSSEGSLLPIGGYKGYGLAVMIGLLAGALNNAAVGRSTVDFNASHDLMTNTGQTIIAVDPSAFGDPDQFIARLACENNVCSHFSHFSHAEMPRAEMIVCPKRPF